MEGNLITTVEHIQHFDGGLGARLRQVVRVLEKGRFVGCDLAGLN